MAKKLTSKKPSKSNNQLHFTSVKKKEPNTFHSNKLVESIPLILLAVCGIIFLYTKVRLLAIPLERDEAGFAYIGHWLLHGKSLESICS